MPFDAMQVYSPLSFLFTELKVKRRMELSTVLEGPRHSTLAAGFAAVTIHSKLTLWPSVAVTADRTLISGFTIKSNKKFNFVR